jgi:hypothetical protein
VVPSERELSEGEEGELWLWCRVQQEEWLAVPGASCLVRPWQQEQPAQQPE